MHRSSFANARSLALASLLGACVLPALTSRAVDYIWDPNGNRSDAAGSGVWNTTSPVWDSGSADVPWTNSATNNAFFNGADGNYNVVVANGIMAGTATFNASGYTLRGIAASPGTLSLGSYIPTALEVASGKTVTFGPYLTVALGQYVNQNATSNGTMAIVGGTVNSASGFSFGGGALNVGAGGTYTSILGNFGSSSRSVGITVDGPGASFSTSRATFTNTTLTVNNGTATLNGGGTGNKLNNTVIQLNAGGTLSFGDINGSDANSAFKLNGGMLRVDQPYVAFAPGANNAVRFLLQGGGMRIFINQDVTLPTGLLHDASGPGIDGGVIKTGSGVLTIASPGTYTGGTAVSEGKILVTANGALGTGNIRVNTTGICLTIGTGVTNPFYGFVGQLTLEGGGTAGVADVGYLDLTSGANITVTRLFLGSDAYFSGVFTSANAPDFILGSGSITVIPEPGTVGLVVLAGAGLGLLVRRRATR